MKFLLLLLLASGSSSAFAYDCSEIASKYYSASKEVMDFRFSNLSKITVRHSTNLRSLALELLSKAEDAENGTIECKFELKAPLSEVLITPGPSGDELSSLGECRVTVTNDSTISERVPLIDSQAIGSNFIFRFNNKEGQPRRLRLAFRIEPSADNRLTLRWIDLDTARTDEGQSYSTSAIIAAVAIPMKKQNIYLLTIGGTGSMDPEISTSCNLY